MNLDRLNVNVGGVPAAGFSGDVSALHRIAEAVGEPLPASYVQFVRRVDGGHPEVGSFSLPGAEPDDLFDVEWFYSIENAAVERVGDVLASWRDVLGPGALPIGRDGGGNQLFLRLGSPDPSVWLYIHDAEVRVHRVADNLAAFLDGLHENPDYI